VTPITEEERHRLANEALVEQLLAHLAKNAEGST
jgi:hypothetical protein